MRRWKTLMVIAAAVTIPSLLAIGAADAATKPAAPPAAGASTTVPRPTTTMPRPTSTVPQPTTTVPRPTKGGKSADKQAKGTEAVQKLGSRIDAVAQKHGKTAAQLTSQLLADQSLFVDDTDGLLYVEPPQPAATGTMGTFDPAIPTSSAFVLHSKPGAKRVIYLDFDGEALSGTAWNSYTGGDCVADPYDSDGAPATFSDSERAEIIGVWKRVSEDYAAFDVDVTTEDPGYAAINRADLNDTAFGTRALITKSTTNCSNPDLGQNATSLYGAVCSGGCGGVAFVGVFDLVGAEHDYYQPALVFQNGVGPEAKYVGEAVSHEVGHNVGLSHDGTSTTGYYGGQGNWAPIMGVGYYRPITQWSKGEYAGANNTEDDFAVAVANGLPLRADDHGNTAATATALSGTTPTVEGVISTRSDVDAFKVYVGEGPATFRADPAPTSPDLDIRLELRTAAGTVVASNDPASGATSGDSATGTGATISATLAPGTYVLFVDGVGSGDPLTTGYSDYASVGRYLLSGSFVAPLNRPPTATIGAGTASGVAPLPVSFTGSGSTDPDGDTLTYAWDFGDGGTASTANPTHTFATDGTFTVRLTVTDPFGNAVSATATITVTAPTRVMDVAAVNLAMTRPASGKAAGTAAVTVTDQLGKAVSGATVTGTWAVAGKVMSTKNATTSTNGVATFSSGTLSVRTGQQVRYCVTKLAATGIPWNATTFSPTTATDCQTWTMP